MLHFFYWLGKQGVNDWVARYMEIFWWVADIGYTVAIIYLAWFVARIFRKGD